MSLLSFFSKAKSVEEQPTAVDYVEWLLKHMLQTSSTELTIDTRRALPGSVPTAKDVPPPCIPDAQAVINRLKILSRVNPVRQTESVGGTFERPRAQDVTIFVTTRFKDDAEKSVCTIRLLIRCKNTSIEASDINQPK